MALDGLHHVTAITADAPANVDFYTRVLGLRMVKKTVNFDAPDVYHLYYGDERGTPGSIMTFFEFPGVGRGRAGDGMIHRILWRVGSEDALEFWADRLGSAPVFSDPEGLEHELVVDATDAPLTAAADDIPAEFAIRGFHGVRAYAGRPARSADVLAATGFVPEGDGAWRLSGGQRHGYYFQDPPPDEPGLQGAGTVHHVAWSAADDGELETMREKLREVGAHPTPIVDRQYFHSVYYREPGFVLFELATRDIGFDIDEPLESLGHDLKLPPQHEHLRAQLEQTLTPLPA